MSRRQAYFASELKTRESEENDKYIEGYFAVFNQETEIWSGWYEQIAAGAFANSLRNSDIRCLFNHDTAVVLGRKNAGTLELKEDVHGLWGRVKVNQSDSQALDIYARVERGDISGCSFGFSPISEDYTTDTNGAMHWVERDVELYEVSICTFPAYPQTEVQARKQDFQTEHKRALTIKKQVLKTKLEGIKC